MNEYNPPRNSEATLPRRLSESGDQERAGRAWRRLRSNEKILGYIREVRQDVRRVERAQQALFALVDSLAKVFVTCVPEPHGVAMETALGEARKRHARLLTNAGQAMLSDSLVTMEDLMSRGQK